MEILDGFDIILGADDVLYGEGTNPDAVRTKKPALGMAASKALEIGLSMVHPVALIHDLTILERRHERILLQGGKDLISPLLTRHLAGADQVTIAICTIGAELETFSATLMEKDPVLGLALDGLGNAAVERTAQLVCERIGDNAQKNNLTTTGPLSPGEPDWTVEVGQREIFAILDPSQVGISLTSGGMMVPKKSISFIVGTGNELSQKEPCELCSLRDRCRYRHA
jgi:hypothetical protein